MAGLEVTRRANHVEAVLGSSNGALTEELIGELDQFLKRHAAQSEAPVLVLRGPPGRFFSPGFHLRQAASLDRPQMSRFIKSFESMYLSLWRHPRPTLALLNGDALAGGCILASCCDFRLAQEGIRIGMTSFNRTLSIPLSAQRIISRLLGDGRARFPLLLGESYDAEEALKMGWIDEAAPAAELPARAEKVVGALAEAAIEAYQTTKSILLQPLSRQLAKEDGRLEEFLDLWFSPANRRRLENTIERLGL